MRGYNCGMMKSLVRLAPYAMAIVFLSGCAPSEFGDDSEKLAATRNLGEAVRPQRAPGATLRKAYSKGQVISDADVQEMDANQTTPEDAAPAVALAGVKVQQSINADEIVLNKHVASDRTVFRAIKDIEKGAALNRQDIEELHLQQVILPAATTASESALVGRRAKRDISEGNLIMETDLE